ncbi:MAG: adenosylhomocysteinase [Thiohalophilus sp.]|nr:adenosylhomocysteinase [Thiohalophilus sp.]MDZ7662636.1 adenosylhomocysteinase [Thiohalophilus sp.]
MAEIANPDLADVGRARIDWALTEMPVIRDLMQELAQEKPLQGLRLSGCLHITTETANLARTLKAAGAERVLCASNPLSTQDDVAASLVQHEHIPVFAWRGESHDAYYRHIHAARRKLAAMQI